MTIADSHEPSVTPPATGDSKEQPLPEGTGQIGMLLFLAALFMLFAASMVGYVLIRLAATRDVIPTNGGPIRYGVPLGTLEFPKILWVSTVVIILSGVAMQAALRAVRIGNQTLFRKLMVVSCVFAAGFVMIQTPAMYWIIADHWEYLSSDVALYGLVFVLILLHAAHVIGGLIPLGIVTVKAQKGRYGIDNNNAVAYTTMYWHFLDAVWIFMFSVMLLLG